MIIVILGHNNDVNAEQPTVGGWRRVLRRGNLICNVATGRCSSGGSVRQRGPDPGVLGRASIWFILWIILILMQSESEWITDWSVLFLKNHNNGFGLIPLTSSMIYSIYVLIFSLTLPPYRIITEVCMYAIVRLDFALNLVWHRWLPSQSTTQVNCRWYGKWYWYKWGWFVVERQASLINTGCWVRSCASRRRNRMRVSGLWLRATAIEIPGSFLS